MFARADSILSPAEVGGVVAGRGFGLSALVVVVSPLISSQDVTRVPSQHLHLSSTRQDPSDLLRGLGECVEHSRGREPW